MADYVRQQQAAFAKALRELENAKRNAEVAQGRYDNAKNNKAGAGRGGQGGPTAEELQKYQSGGQTPEVGIKMRSGGAVSASRRGDGVAQRGKTRGKMR
jgi:hypothetical protein